MSDLIKHEVLKSGIHHFIWMNNSSESVHIYIRAFNKLIQETLQSKPAEQVTLRFILDFRQTSLPPFTDVVAETVDSRRRSSLSTDKITCRFAYMSDDDKLADLLFSIASLTPASYRRKVFKADEQTQAIAWLLDDEA